MGDQEPLSKFNFASNPHVHAIISPANAQQALKEQE